MPVHGGPDTHDITLDLTAAAGAPGPAASDLGARDTEDLRAYRDEAARQWIRDGGSRDAVYRYARSCDALVARAATAGPVPV
jgi:hypothetical protein